MLDIQQMTKFQQPNMTTVVLKKRRGRFVVILSVYKFPHIYTLYYMYQKIIPVQLTHRHIPFIAI